MSNWFIAIALLLITIVWKWSIQRKKSPPGPIGLPIVGYYPFLGSNHMQKLLQLADHYGDIMKINILGSDFYFLNTLLLIKEAMENQGNNFSVYPHEFNLYSFSFERSKITAESNLWSTHQKFMIRGMSSLGMGKSSLEPKIHEICDAMVSNIAKLNGECCDVFEILTNYTSNIISMFLYGEYYNMDDPVYINLRNQIHDFYLSVRDFDAFHTIIRFKGNSIERLTNVRKQFNEYVDAIFNKRLMENNNNTDDILGLYLTKYLDEKNSGEKDKLFDLETVKSNWFRMFVVGTDTSSTSLYHALCLMIVYPDIQWKVQKEIDDVIGKNGIISLQDRSRLNYTQAVFAEIQRYSCVVPFGVYHLNYKETIIGGYEIPKRSIVIPNAWKVSRDSTHFKYPNQFEPRNFFDKNGKFVNNEYNIRFSIEKQMFLGSNLANAELFIAFVTLLQKFEWQPSPGEQIEYQPFDSIVRRLKNFKAAAVKR